MSNEEIYFVYRLMQACRVTNYTNKTACKNVENNINGYVFRRYIFIIVQYIIVQNISTF